jgi:hypothetical protein
VKLVIVYESCAAARDTTQRATMAERTCQLRKAERTRDCHDRCTFVPGLFLITEGLLLLWPFYDKPAL